MTSQTIFVGSRGRKTGVACGDDFWEVVGAAGEGEGGWLGFIFEATKEAVGRAGAEKSITGWLGPRVRGGCWNPSPQLSIRGVDVHANGKKLQCRAAGGIRSQPRTLPLSRTKVHTDTGRI